MRKLLVIAAPLALCACGSVQALKPAAGASLPPKAEAATVAPKPEDMMNATTQARPGRSDDVLYRSEKRQHDKFDLPPPG